MEIEKGSARLGVHLSTNGLLRIELAGGWVLATGTPTFESVAQILGKDRGFTRAVFDGKKLTAWDSAAIAFLVQTSQQLRSQGIAEDRSGLPAGLQRLIALAEAVPERS